MAVFVVVVVVPDYRTTQKGVVVPCVAVRYVGDWKSRERERDARGKLSRTKRREEKEEETLDQAAQAFGDASWSQATN